MYRYGAVLMMIARACRAPGGGETATQRPAPHDSTPYRHVAHRVLLRNQTLEACEQGARAHAGQCTMGAGCGDTCCATGTEEPNVSRRHTRSKWTPDKESQATIPAGPPLLRCWHCSAIHMGRWEPYPGVPAKPSHWPPAPQLGTSSLQFTIGYEATRTQLSRKAITDTNPTWSKRIHEASLDANGDAKLTHLLQQQCEAEVRCPHASQPKWDT